MVGSLPKYLDSENFDVRVVIPGYECINDYWKNQMETVIRYPVYYGDEIKAVTLKSLVHDKITYYFLEQAELFAGDKPYGDMWEDAGKFIFFSKAVLELLAYIDFEPDVIHCHDWQVGLIPALLKTTYAGNPFYGGIKSVVTIHNLRFKGLCDINFVKYLTGMPDEAFAFDKLEYYGNASMLKGGLAYADLITTVSETYAKEIQTSECGEGLEGLLSYRKDDLIGIINGIDYDVYDPMGDIYLEDHFDADSFEEGKKKNKEKLQKLVGLPQDPDAFVIGIISRLTEQKGFDLIGPVIEDLMEENIQLVILGDGEKQLSDMFAGFMEKYPDKVLADFNYNDRLAKYIYAGSDASLLPSRFEPCGLSQLMALRYGCVPIVRWTGGLADTVKDYDPTTNEGTGFGFRPLDSKDFLKSVERANDLFKGDKDAWKCLVKRGMEEDFSWKTSAKKYEAMYAEF